METMFNKLICEGWIHKYYVFYNLHLFQIPLSVHINMTLYENHTIKNQFI